MSWFNIHHPRAEVFKAEAVKIYPPETENVRSLRVAFLEGAAWQYDHGKNSRRSSIYWAIELYGEHDGAVDRIRAFMAGSKCGAEIRDGEPDPPKTVFQAETSGSEDSPVTVRLEYSKADQLKLTRRYPRRESVYLMNTAEAKVFQEALDHVLGPRTKS